jgi:hypothetical protein
MKKTDAMLTIYNPETAEERSCSQAEFDETFAPAGWELVEPIEEAAPIEEESPRGRLRLEDDERQ